MLMLSLLVKEVILLCFRYSIDNWESLQHWPLQTRCSLFLFLKPFIHIFYPVSETEALARYYLSSSAYYI